MMEGRYDGRNNCGINHIPDGSWATHIMGMNQLTSELVKVEHTTEDEYIEVQHLLAETHFKNTNALYVGSEGTGKGLSGIMYASLVGRYDSKYQFADSVLRGFVEEDDLHFRCNPDSICSGYLTSAGFAGRNIQLRPCLNNVSSIKSSSSECQTYITERDLDLGEMPNLSNVANLVPKSTPHENMLCLGVMSIHDLQEAFRNMFGQATSVRDKQWLIRRMLFGLQNISEIGIMDASLVGRYDSKYQFVDSMLRGVVEEGDLHFRCNSDSICSGRNIQLRPCLNNGSSIKSLSSECQTYITDRDLSLGEMPNLSNAANLIPKSTPDENLLCHDVMSIHELQEAFRNMFGQATSVRDKQWLIRRMLFGLQNISEIGNVSNLVDCGLSPFENEISLILSPETDLSEMMYSSCSNMLDSRTCRFGYSCLEDVHAVEHDLPATFEDDRLVFGALKEQEGTFVTSKRLRKRTRRYIEEMSGMESRCSSERVESPSSSSDDRLLHVRKRSRYYRKRLTEMEVGSDYQMPCGLDTTFARNDCCKEDTQSMVVSKRVIATRPFESDSEDDLSDDSYTATKKEKSVDRRQQHKQWTIPEAMKLIEGVSQFGVGRWTAIKKRLFSTSSYRTPVDLKDKWRNLLRASGAQLHGRKKVRPQKQMTVPLPQTALQRIRELAIIHPYPRPKKNAHLCAAASNNGSRNSTSIRRHAATVR